MPEFHPTRRPAIPREEQMREYRGETKKKKPVFSPKKRKAAKIEHEVRTALPPQSPVRRQRAEELRRQEENTRKNKAPAKKRRRRKSLLLYKVMIAVVVIVLVSVLSVTVLFNIGSINVSGSEKYTSDEIAAVCGISVGDNLLRINTGAAEEKILGSLVYIDTVSVSRGFPNRLNISVTDAAPMADFRCGGEYRVISYKGKYLETLSAPKNHITVTGFDFADGFSVGSVLTDNEKGQLEALNVIISEMDGYNLNASAVIDVSDMMNVTIKYDGRIDMHLGAPSQVHEKMYAASVLVTSEIGSGDKVTMLLENPERVVTRPIYDSEIKDDGFIPETTPAETTAPEDAGDPAGSETTAE